MMPYVTFNISDKIEMSGFKTENEARAHCRRRYSQYNIIFEGTFEDIDADRPVTPIAIYVRGKGYNCAPIEKDVPYTTYKVIESKLPQEAGFAFIRVEHKTYYQVHDEIEAAFTNGARVVWEIYEDSRMITVWTAADRKQLNWYRENQTIDGGEIAPEYMIQVADLFEEVVVE